MQIRFNINLRSVPVAVIPILAALWMPPAVHTQTGWVEIPLPVTDQDLAIISFADSNHGCLCGSPGVFLHTSDNGTTWRTDSIPFPAAIGWLGGCRLVNDSVAWAWGHGNLEMRQWSVVRSTDAGRTWATRNPPESLYVLGVAFSSANRAWAVTPTRIWTTSDAGESWEPRGTVNPWGYWVQWWPHALEFQGDSVGYLGGSGGLSSNDLAPMMTHDGGWTWEGASFLTSNGPFWRGEPVRFLHDTIQTFRKSSRVDEITNTVRTDLILSWNGMRDSRAFTWFSGGDAITPAGVALDASHIWILRDSGPHGFGPTYLERTTDGGTAWTVDTFSVLLADLLVDKYGNRFAIGAGRLFEFTGPLHAGDYPGELPAVTTLYQNYPNPFNPGTTITLAVDQRVHVSLRLYDVLGREIAILVNDTREAGRHEVYFDGTDLPSGVYYYRLLAGHSRYSQQMLLLK